MEYQVWPGRVVVNRAPISKGPSKSNFAGGSFQLAISVQNLHANGLGALHSAEYSNSQTGSLMLCVIVATISPAGLLRVTPSPKLIPAKPCYAASPYLVNLKVQLDFRRATEDGGTRMPCDSHGNQHSLTNRPNTRGHPGISYKAVWICLELGP